MEEREAEPYNETLVMEQMVKQGKNTVLAHLRHLKDHGAEDFLREAIAYIKENKIDLDITKKEPAEQHAAVHHEMMAAKATGCGGGCPGTMPVSFDIDIEEVKKQGMDQLLLKPGRSYGSGRCSCICSIHRRLI